MAVTMYIGTMGAGKSYEVVKSVIVPALKAGRTVVTNVDGLNVDRLMDLTGCAEEQIVSWTNEQFADETNYPQMSKPELSYKMPLGALLVIDEAYTSFGTEKGQVTDRMVEFIRTHRHFVDPKTKVATDVVMISQDVMGLSTRVRNVAEFVYRVRSMKFIPFMKKRYSFVAYSSAKFSKQTMLRAETRRYEPWVFKLYASYKSGAGARQVLTDSSMKMLRWWHWLLILIIVTCFIFWARGVGATADIVSGKKVLGVVSADKECQKSGSLVDVDERKYLKSGSWHDVAITKLEDGRERWQLDTCWIGFGSRGNR